MFYELNDNGDMRKVVEVRTDRESRLRKVAKYLKAQREKYGVTKEEVALYCGYSVANIVKFELGVNNNAIVMLAYLALLPPNVSEGLLILC